MIHKMEKKLPFVAFRLEWEEVGKGEDPKKYLPFSKIELTVPCVFAVLYFAILIWTTQ